MIIKEIKDYSNRMRINIVSSDGFNPGDEVVLLSKSEYDKLHEEIFNREEKIVTLTKENEIIKQRSDTVMASIKESKKDLDTELDKLLDITLKPINETHDKQLEDKDRQIQKLTDRIDAMQIAFNQFIVKINSLSTWNIFRKKHVEVIDNFANSVWAKTDGEIVDANIKQITEKK